MEKCYSCRNRKIIEEGLGLAVGVRKDYCKKFVESDGVTTNYLLCGYAYNEFCRGGDWQPSLYYRIKSFFKGV